MTGFLVYLKNWKDSKGCMSRHEYWSGFLSILVILAVLIVCKDYWAVAKYPMILFAAAMVVPYITATIRRLHDVNREAGSMLFMFIPVIGWLYLFILLIQDSKKEGRT